MGEYEQKEERNKKGGTYTSRDNKQRGRMKQEKNRAWSQSVTIETFTQKGAQIFGYKTDTLTQGELSNFEVSKLLQNFEILELCM